MSVSGLLWGRRALLLAASLVLAACSAENPIEPETALQSGRTANGEGGTQSVSKRPQPKILLCHREEEGGFHVLSVSESALADHEEHGDWVVGDEVCDGLDNDCDGLVDNGVSCVECAGDADCDNGMFCDGSETCHAGSCEAGTPPCEGLETCDEALDICAPPCLEENAGDCLITPCCQGLICVVDGGPGVCLALP